MSSNDESLVIVMKICVNKFNDSQPVVNIQRQICKFQSIRKGKHESQLNSLNTVTTK